MLDNFLMASRQTLIVFIMIAIGYFCGKKELLTTEVADGMANIVIDIVMPAVIILAFQREFEAKLARKFLLSMLLSAIGYVVILTIARLTIRDADKKRRNALQLAAAYPNISMFSMPMQLALFGGEGVFCGAAQIAVFNILFWPYTEVTCGDGTKISIKAIMKKVFINPCVLATMFSLILFFCRVEIKGIPRDVLSSFNAVCTPLSMLILGQKLTRCPIKQLFGDKGNVIAAMEKLVVLPLIMLVIMKIFGTGGVVGVSALIGFGSPAAACVGMVAVTYDQRPELAASAVSVSLLISLITLPLITALGCTMLM